MEIKIQCGCGSKYKFDVEPINNRMPYPVSCPSCGVDGTEQANTILRNAAETTSASPTYPTAAAVSAPAALRITKSAQSPEQQAAAPAPIRVVNPAPAKAASSRIKTVLTTIFTVLVVAFGLWKFGTKWYRRINAVVQVAKEVTSGKAGSEGDEIASSYNFWQEDCVVLFIRHTNELEIAQACKDYWQSNCKKTLTVSEAQDPGVGAGQYCLIAPHNGYVRVMGGLEWPQQQYEGLAKTLSEKFKTLVFETRDVDFSGAYHFGVYEEGTRKFHAQMDVRISNNNADEIVTTENNDWAIAHGYKPGPEGFKEFHMGDANEISQKLGLKMWDEKEGQKSKVFALKET